VVDAEIVEETVHDEQCDCDRCAERIEAEISRLNAEAARIEASLQPVKETTWTR
jgi:hypothetical protein